MLNNEGRTQPSGTLALHPIRARKVSLAWKLRNNLTLRFLTGWLARFVMLPIAQHFGLMAAVGELAVTHFRFETEAEATHWRELRQALRLAQSLDDGDLAEKLQVEIAQLEARRIPVHYGVVGRRVVTTAFVTFVVDQLQTETSVFGDFKFHDSGVGTTAENITDTGIETTDGESRATGTQTESAANAYRSVGTISYTSTKAITEHGLFNDATTGTLMDRTVFSAVNVVNGESIQFTYTLTLTAGS
jgi:hypothetical protein